jgi:hypothetical protein
MPKLVLKLLSSVNGVQVVNACFGYIGSNVFAALVAYRLLATVWQSAIAAGLLLSETQGGGLAGQGGSGFFWGGLLAGVAPLVCAQTGGQRALYIMHTIQAFLLFVMLVSSVATISSFPCWLCVGGDWTFSGGGDEILARVVQAFFSWPWCTAVLTDRLFIGSPGRALIGVGGGIILAATYSMCGSFIGIYARYRAGGAAVTFVEPIDMARTMSEAHYHLFLFMSMLSAVGSINAAFCAVAKLGGLEIFGLLMDPHGRAGGVVSPLAPGDAHVSLANVVAARVSVLALAAIGLSTLSFEDIHPGSLEIASPTNIMLIGLGAPIALLALWNRSWRRAPLAFLCSIIVGLIIGIIDKQRTTCGDSVGHHCARWIRSFTPGWGIGNGSARIELGLTVFGLLISFLAAMVGFALDQHFRLPDDPQACPNQT